MDRTSQLSRLLRQWSLALSTIRHISDNQITFFFIQNERKQLFDSKDIILRFLNTSWEIQNLLFTGHFLFSTTFF